MTLNCWSARERAVLVEAYMQVNSMRFHLGLQLQPSPLPAKGVLLADYANLGRSGLSVSRLCLGTMNFGPLTPPAQAHVIMDHAHDLGINFDTANRRRAQAPG